MEAAIQVTKISKTFTLSRKQQKIEQSKTKTKVAVNDLSFEAYPHEIYGLLGPNGAGKTTTLRCISTLIKPDMGDILVQGKSVMKEAGDVRNAIGFLTSDMKLEDFFTPNYLFDYFSKLHGVPEDLAAKRKAALFHKFGIDRFAEVKVGELSSGMRQKAQLAISLVHDPDVIIFDEPTNGLDVLTAKVVTDYLIELKNEDKAIVVSTHIFSLVEKICDRVGIILNGKLKATGLLQDLVAPEDTLEDYFFRLAQEEGDIQ